MFCKGGFKITLLGNISKIKVLYVTWSAFSLFPFFKIPHKSAFLKKPKLLSPIKIVKYCAMNSSGSRYIMQTETILNWKKGCRTLEIQISEEEQWWR